MPLACEAFRLGQARRMPYALRENRCLLFLGHCSRFSLVQFNIGGEPLNIRRQICNLLFLLRQL
jgi:hypothetical protein